MTMLTVEKDSLDRPVELHYEDIGYGPTVVLVHGWPFDHGMWESQRYALANGGCRVVAYDQRGFGRSSKPAEGYHYNRLTDDLRALLDALDLQDVALVGFSMGAGQVVHYMSRNLGQRVRQVALVSSVTPSLPGHDSAGDSGFFQTMVAGARADRLACIEPLARQMFAGAQYSGASDATLEWMMKSAAFSASSKAMVDTALAMLETDLTGAMKAVANVPSLVIHGTEDRIAPFASNGLPTAGMLPDCTFKPYEGAPHGLFATHAGQLSEDLLKFIHNPPTYVLRGTGT
jgi:pimeloyl-ACP methyl ester carboxylesterase